MWFVSTSGDGDDTGNGTIDRPFATVAAALDAARKWSRTSTSGAPNSVASKSKSIVLRGGIHFLNSTLTLGPADSGTTITVAAGEEAWLSGGTLIPVGAPWRQQQAAYSPTNDGTAEPTVWVLDLPSLDDVLGLFSLNATLDSHDGQRQQKYVHRRFTRARFPNADVEVTQWGYASEGRFNFSLPAGTVSEWHRPPVAGAVPSYTFVNLSDSNNPSHVVKNDSTMPACVLSVCSMIGQPL